MAKGKTESQVSVKKKTWKEFKDTKLLWWINRILHTFGWAIVYQLDGKGEIIEVYPARVTYRGFSEKSEAEGFTGISQYLKYTVADLEKEIR